MRKWAGGNGGFQVLGRGDENRECLTGSGFFAYRASRSEGLDGSNGWPWLQEPENDSSSRFDCPKAMVICGSAANRPNEGKGPSSAATVSTSGHSDRCSN